MFPLPPLEGESFHDPVRVADWVELNLLLEQADSVSVTAVTDELAETPPDDSEDSERRFEGDEPERRGYWEAAEELAESAFGELSQREAWLLSHYPLTLVGDTALLNSATSAREAYSFLILLRARQMYDRALGDDGEESGELFEDLVKHALGSYVDATMEHRLRFGVAGGHRGDGLPDSLPEAVEELRKRLHEEPGEVPEGGQGDYKADAIVWKPLGDQRPGQLVVLGQATMSEGDWMREDLPNRWADRQPAERRLIDFIARPVAAVAFAETLSLTPRDTLRGLAATFSSIPFDRLRLLRVLSDSDLPADLRARMNAWGSGMTDRLLQ